MIRSTAIARSGIRTHNRLKFHSMSMATKTAHPVHTANTANTANTINPRQIFLRSLSSNVSFDSTNSTNSIHDANPNKEKKRRKSFKSFLDEVDAQMKRNSPEKYEQFVRSRAAAERRREMNLQNRQGRVGRRERERYGGHGGYDGNGVQERYNRNDRRDGREMKYPMGDNAGRELGRPSGSTERSSQSSHADRMGSLSIAQRSEKSMGSVEKVGSMDSFDWDTRSTKAGNIVEEVEAESAGSSFARTPEQQSHQLGSHQGTSSLGGGQSNSFSKENVSRLSNLFSPSSPSKSATTKEGKDSGKISIFSSIAQSANASLASKNSHTNTSTTSSIFHTGNTSSSTTTSNNIPPTSIQISNPADNTTTTYSLAELFPSLHDNPNLIHAIETKTPPIVDPKLLYPPDLFRHYRETMETIFEEEHVEKVFEKFLKRGNGRDPVKAKETRREKEEIVVQVKEWLLCDHRIVSEEGGMGVGVSGEGGIKGVKERWEGLNEIWREGWIKGGGTSVVESMVDSVVESNDDSEEEDGDAVDNVPVKEQSKLLMELQEQREIFNKEFLAMQRKKKEAEDKMSSTSSVEKSSTTDQSDQLELTDMTPPAQPTELSPQFQSLAEKILASLARYCARRARTSPLEVAWYKIKESGMVLTKDTIQTLLYVFTTMGISDSMGLTRRGVGTLGWSSSSGPGDSGSSSSMGSSIERGLGIAPFNSSAVEEENESQKNAFVIPEEVATYHDLLSRPTESSVSLRVKALTSQGDVKNAEELLESFKKSIESDTNSKESLKLRTYIPVLKLHCENDDVSSALKLFHQMKITNGVVLEPETYVTILAAVAKNGYFWDDSPPIEGAQSIGYNHASGPQLFDEIATEMAAEVLEISSSSARRLSNALAAGFKKVSNTSADASNKDSNDGDIRVHSQDGNGIISNLVEAHPLASIPTTRQPAKPNEIVACRVMIDRSTGICPVTNALQRLILLEPHQRKQLHDDIIELSKEQLQNFLGKKDEKAAEKAALELSKFSDWLDTREGEPFTAIVDGANVGYYMQTFWKGKFNYHQIKFMVDTLERRGEKPLVVLPFKYGCNDFYSSKKELQILDAEEKAIRDELISSGKLYRVPPRCFDDFYWMVASISDQNASRNGRDLYVPTGDPTGRFPGARPMLISNDQMRDHRLELLEPRLFRRWYGCHIVNYSFTAFVDGECVDGNEIGFSQADFFSREIQGNISLSKDTSGSVDDGQSNVWGGQAWHFPVSDWDLDERFVVRIPSLTKKSKD